MEKIKKGKSFYASVHYWLKINYGVATKCENKKCVGRSINYQWAKKKEKGYEYKRENFFQLCRSCHAQYDCTEKTRRLLKKHHRNTEKTHCIVGHKFDKENTFLYIGKARAGVLFRNSMRLCRECGRIRHRKWLSKNKEYTALYNRNYRRKLKK